MNRWITILALALLAACTDRGGEQGGAEAPPGADEVAQEEVLKVFLRMRGAAEPSAEQRAAAEKDLESLYLLAEDARRQGLDDAPEVRAELKLQELMALANLAVTARAEADPIGDAEVQAEYDRQLGMVGGEEYQLSHLLFASQEQAQSTLQRLEGGESFASLLAADNGAQGGELGWVDPSQLPQAFASAVEALAPGEYTREPIQTEFGWHIVYLQDRRPLTPPPLESVRTGIEAALGRARVDAYLEELRARESTAD